MDLLILKYIYIYIYIYNNCMFVTISLGEFVADQMQYNFIYIYISEIYSQHETKYYDILRWNKFIMTI